MMVLASAAADALSVTWSAQAAVDLHGGDRVAAQVGQRGMPRAEVIQRQGHAELGELLDAGLAVGVGERRASLSSNASCAGWIR